jgi:hypothetical protein
MAKLKESVSKKPEKKKVSRPGRHSKKKSSGLKSSKNYLKKYRSQGK